MSSPRYPSLYQINTRVWLTELSRKLRRPANLDDIPDGELDRLADFGFDWIWMLSVWRTGREGQRVSRTNPEWRAGFLDTLPDLRDEDIPGSGFAITGYTVHDALGGRGALERLRDRLQTRGLKLMLDFVPNHTGLDHPWVEEHPEYYVPGTELDLARAPGNYVWAKRRAGDRLLAHGRDPYFSGWRDTLQLNYANPATLEAMTGELLSIAEQCDGVRCDMAMLVLPDVFERTWGQRAPEFWPAATSRIRAKHPGFCFMAEVYWDREWELQQQGFDYTYDKRLYDRLREGHSRPVHDHLLAGLDYQDRLARFLENHDEPRAAATFPLPVHKAAAAVTFLTPGLRFFHQGQFEGRLKHISPHLGRAPQEPRNDDIAAFYERLLPILRRPEVRDGEWRLLECRPAWDGNPTHDNFIAFHWRGPRGQRMLTVVNYAGSQGQCYIRRPFDDLGDRTWVLRDLLGEESYERQGRELTGQGLYIDAAPWQASAFAFEECVSRIDVRPERLPAASEPLYSQGARA
ncbi:MAG: hypothetical protein KF774_06035 [Planctomyces sp.]|nr:hypothetical protein [Planctomyces sp.]